MIHEHEVIYVITGINPEAVKWGDDHYDRPLCPGLQPGPPSQTPGGLGQGYWSVSKVTWPPNLELRRWRSSGPSSRMAWEKLAGNVTNSLNLSHMCAYSAILRLKIIHNKPIEAVELSKIPRDIRGRVPLSEIISPTDFGWDDVVQQPPISRSYLKYWAYQIYIYIYIYKWTVGPLWIFPRAGAGYYRWNLLFSFFYFPQSTMLKDMCILLLMKPAFYFWTYFFQTPPSF